MRFVNEYTGEVFDTIEEVEESEKAYKAELEEKEMRARVIAEAKERAEAALNEYASLVMDSDDVHYTIKIREKEKDWDHLEELMKKFF